MLSILAWLGTAECCWLGLDLVFIHQLQQEYTLPLQHLVEEPNKYYFTYLPWAQSEVQLYLDLKKIIKWI